MNQKFEFTDLLDLETILDTQDEVPNRYHLHAIIIHEGKSDSGHYYTYIRPRMDDSWFKFNDRLVNRVSKQFAISSGTGG